MSSVPGADSENFELLSFRVLNENHLKLVLRLEGRAEPLNAIHFNGWGGVSPPSRVMALFKIEPIQLNVDEKLAREEFRFPKVA